MGNLSKNFSRSEFECSCGCEFDTVDTVLLRVLQGVADHYSVVYRKVRVTITSGCRCLAHNEEVQNEYNPSYVPFSSKSQHLYGKAVDFKVHTEIDGKWVQIPPDNVYEYIDQEYPDTLGLGMYSNRNHVDSRQEKARW